MVQLLLRFVRHMIGNRVLKGPPPLWGQSAGGHAAGAARVCAGGRIADAVDLSTKKEENE
jgi:hypothetical protein